MSKLEEYTLIANTMSEETKTIFEDGAYAIQRVLNLDDVRYDLPSSDVITLAELGVLLKVLPMFAERKEK